MAHFHRLIFCALVMLGAWLPTSSHASFPATSDPTICTVAPCYQYQAVNDGTWKNTLLLAAQNSVGVKPAGCTGFSVYTARLCGAQTAAPSTYYAQPDYCGTSNLTFSCNTYTAGTRTVAPSAPVYSCPANSTLSGSSCTCNSPYSQDVTNTSCQINNCPSVGVSDGYYGNLSRSGTLYVCDIYTASGDPLSPFCVITITTEIGTKATPTSPYIYSGPAKFTRDKCTGTGTGDGSAVGVATPNGTGTTSPQTNPCPNGQPGTVNGLTVCVPFAPGVTVQTPVNSSSTKTDPSTGTTSSTTTGTTTCEAGVCTTINSTSTSVNGGTPVITTSSSQQPQSAYCTANTKEKVCGGTDPSAFGGSCTGGFTCSGDAVQCALAREVHLQDCKLNAATAESSLYDTSKLLTGDQTTALPGNSSVAISSASFDQSNGLGVTGAGLSDLNLTVWNKPITLHMSAVNPWLSNLGSLLMGVTFLLCIRIVSRG